MPDMLVKLYHVQPMPEQEEALRARGIFITRVLPPDRHLVLNFITEHFSEGWASECMASFSYNPVSCYIAVKDKQVIGFACYNATAKDYFGPTGVDPAYRGQSVGAALLLRCMLSLKEEGYGYAIIGGVGGARTFYEKVVGATVIENSVPGLYAQMVCYAGNVTKGS
ncbi:MAG: GNAT family N-acetyltransferase [Clostridia bacterium]